MGNGWGYKRCCPKRDFRGSRCSGSSRSKYLYSKFSLNFVLNFFCQHLVLIELFKCNLQEKLGRWCYKSKRCDIMHNGHMFPLLVKKELDQWPEQNIRQRKWVCVLLFTLQNSMICDYHHFNVLNIFCAVLCRWRRPKLEKYVSKGGWRKL